MFYIGVGVYHTTNDECCQIFRMGCHRIETGKSGSDVELGTNVLNRMQTSSKKNRL